jgi:ubiquinone/menaquinone biosynthesis C-methylase UbiE
MKNVFARLLFVLLAPLCLASSCKDDKAASSPQTPPQTQSTPIPAPIPAPTPALPQADQAQPQSAPATTQSVYEYRPGSRDGIDKWYMGRQIAHVMGHQAADWLERPEREQEENPTRLIEILKKRVRPTDVFADIGCGTGYYSFRLAPLVPQGKILGVDIQQEMLDLLTAEAKKRGVTNVEPVLGTVDDPKLPPSGVDYALLVDAYHEFDHPREMMLAIYNALKPGGKVLLVEFRGEDPNVPIKPLHKMTVAQAKKEMDAVGLKFVESIEELPWQHVMIFERPKE